MLPQSISFYCSLSGLVPVSWGYTHRVIQLNITRLLCTMAVISLYSFLQSMGFPMFPYPYQLLNIYGFLIFDRWKTCKIISHYLNSCFFWLLINFRFFFNIHLSLMAFLFEKFPFHIFCCVASGVSVFFFLIFRSSMYIVILGFVDFRHRKYLLPFCHYFNFAHGPLHSTEAHTFS